LNAAHLLYYRARQVRTDAAASKTRSARATAAPPRLTRAAATVHDTGGFDSTWPGGICALQAASNEKLKELPCRSRERVLCGAVKQRAEDLEQASPFQHVVVFGGWWVGKCIGKWCDGSPLGCW
jgi:hypothetical protein